jgi:ribonuclease HI
MCDVIPYIRDPIVAETLVACRAVQFAQDIGAQSVELEGDAHEVILALGNSSESDSIVGNLVCEAKRKLENFPFWRVSHVRRDGNRAAHALAKFATSQQSHYVWFNSCPSWLLSIVIADSH